jgi:hypothetical protein
MALVWQVTSMVHCNAKEDMATEFEMVVIDAKPLRTLANSGRLDLMTHCVRVRIADTVIAELEAGNDPIDNQALQFLKEPLSNGTFVDVFTADIDEKRVGEMEPGIFDMTVLKVLSRYAKRSESNRAFLLLDDDYIETKTIVHPGTFEVMSPQEFVREIDEIEKQ